MQSGFPTDVWAGREPELAVLRRAIEDLGAGVGTVVWVDGEPGIGKSALVGRALEMARAAGFDVLAGTADPISARSPLHVLLDLLRISPRSPDPRRREIATVLAQRRFGMLGGTDTAAADAELLTGLVDELCAAGPTVIAVDDLQHLDDASLLVWHRLAGAADQLPLLLIATVRPAPMRPQVWDLKVALQRCGRPVLTLEPLGGADADAVLSALASGLSPDARERLRSLALGNPLYLRELADAARREGELGRLPTSFADALTGRLRVVPPGAAQMLRMAALLGGRFSIGELMTLMRRPATELVPAVQDALAAGILVEADGQLTFRHPLIRQALYDATPPAVLAELHRDAAKALAAAGSSPLRIAEQLLASGVPGDAWTRSWLVEHATALAAHAPGVVVELLDREADAEAADDEHGVLLLAVLAWVLLSAGRFDDAVERARGALRTGVPGELHAEMSFVLVRGLSSLGAGAEALDAVLRALSRTDLPMAWRARLLVLLAVHQRAEHGDADTAEDSARQALRLAETMGDTFGTAYALSVRWLIESVRRDHVAALAFADRALDTLSAGPDHADLRALVQDSRIFTLQNLSRWREAAQVMQHEKERGAHRATGARPGVTAAVLCYWLGRWDEALDELEPGLDAPAGVTYAGLREPGPRLLWFGVAALIAARRDNGVLAQERLDAAAARPIRTVGDRENIDFLVAAQAVLLEQRNEPVQAIAVFAELVLDRGPAETLLTHQWLPDLVRLALQVGDTQVVRAALAQVQAEATAETTPARAAAAALRCQGLAWRDPVLLSAAADHYRDTGAVVELAAALEDLAVVLAARGEQSRARDVAHEATTRYEEFGADWEIRRADHRLREHGVRRGSRGRRVRRDAGGSALTPVETRVAEMVADGLPTSAIAATLVLSPRTVQAHISRVIAKLGVRGRVEIVREVYRMRAEGS